MLGIDIVRAGARRHRDRVALVCGDRRLTFREADAASNRLARTLIAHGVAPHSRVALLLGNGLWTVPLDYACVKARATRVPLNPRLSATEHARMLEDADVAALIYDASLQERASELVDRTGGLQMLSLGPGRTGDPDLLDASKDADASDPLLAAEADDVVVALYTSGTTGTLKAAQHTQRSWTAITVNTIANVVSPGPGDVMLHAAPLIHASGLFVLPFWLRGGRQIVLEGFDPAGYAQAIAEHRATHINLVPTMLQILLAIGVTGEQVSSLRSVIYGASPMPRTTIEQAIDSWGPIFTQYYGQTEAPLAICTLRPEDHAGRDAPLGACGQPAVDAELRLLDPEGREVADGQVGEVVVRAPFQMAGYLDAPELNEDTFLPGGWLRTRDLAHRDERGFIHLGDRTSDMIVSGGYNVYPREVEDALYAHPAVAECAVVGEPHEQWVESVVAFVALRPGAQAGEHELRESVRERLAGYKVPRRVEFVEQIPKSAVGKILRRALRDRLGEERTV